MPGMPIAFKQRLYSLPLLGPVFKVLASIKNLRKTLQLIQSQQEQQQKHLNSLEQTLHRQQEQQLERLNSLEQGLKQRQQTFKLDMARALARKQDIAHRAPPAPVPQPLPNDLEGLYIAFENQFRGTAAEIRQQQAKYLPFLTAMAQNSPAPLKVLDIGCGRGEWLQLLTEHNYHACGLDINQTMVDYCRLEGLQAEQGDALAYLADQADGTFDVITAFHVIEHLSFEQMVGLFDQCLCALKPGGKIIFETPNPENLTVGAYSFYLDPTHKNPLPPISIEFIARQRGYTQVDIFRYNPREEPGEDTTLIENWFRSPVDFAVIAEK